MKPVVIPTGNGCKWCDGFGVMGFFAGPERKILAPCLECSPTKNLNDLLRERHKAVMAAAKAEELRDIAAHNERIGAGKDSLKGTDT